MRPLARGLRNQFLLRLVLGSEGSKIVTPLSLLLLTWTPLPCWLWKEWKAASYLPSWCPTPQPTSTEENAWLIFPDSLRTLPTGKEDFSLFGIPSQSSFFFAHRKKKSSPKDNQRNQVSSSNMAKEISLCVSWEFHKWSQNNKFIPTENERRDSRAWGLQFRGKGESYGFTLPFCFISLANNHTNPDPAWTGFDAKKQVVRKVSR